MSPESAIRRCPPAVYLVGIIPLSHHRLMDDSLTSMAFATCFGARSSDIFIDRFGRFLWLV